MSATKTINPKEVSQQELHQYLLAAVAPRPICFASTIDLNGNVNLSPFSFFNVFSSNPPIMVFSPARRGRDNTTKDSYENVLQVKEVTINIVNYAIVEQMSLSSTEYEKGVNEFVKAGLTQVESTLVKPPRVQEAPVSFECRVNDVVPLGDGPGAGNLVISEVVLVHIQEKYLDEQGKLDTKKLDLVARMGGSYYCRAIEESLFEIAKPLSKCGIGVDQLPESIRLSSILTGNDLGRLGNIEKLPSRQEVEEVERITEFAFLKDLNPDSNQHRDSIHKLAQDLLNKGESLMALKILLYRNQHALNAN